jgi:hypothetical protein
MKNLLTLSMFLGFGLVCSAQTTTTTTTLMGFPASQSSRGAIECGFTDKVCQMVTTTTSPYTKKEELLVTVNTKNGIELYTSTDDIKDIQRQAHEAKLLGGKIQYKNLEPVK